MTEGKGPDRKFRDIKEIDVKELCLDVPLYELIQFNKDDAEILKGIEFFEGTFDCYCIDCGMSSVFKANGKDKTKLVRGGYLYLFSDHMFDHHFLCSRNRDHNLFFLFFISKFNLIKIGQYPSIADIAKANIQKYRKVLKETFAELSRGIGLASHGIGIGSFVYLRRIFENVIYEAYDKAKIEAGWNEEQYHKRRMDEKILLLQNHLPLFLVDNRALYSILSKGVHELSEQECLGAFPIVKLGIEMILDEKIVEQEKQAKEAEAKKAIAKLKGEMKS